MDAIIGIRPQATVPEKRHRRAPIRAPEAGPAAVVSLQSRPAMGSATEQPPAPPPVPGPSEER